MEPNENSAGWNNEYPYRGFRIIPGPRRPGLNANVPTVSDWYDGYLEVEDVRPGDEQGNTDLWGIPEILLQNIFQFLTKKNFMLFRRVSRSAQAAVDNSRGLLFDAYQERLSELCEIETRNRWGRQRGPLGNMRCYRCKTRVSIDLGLGDNSRINGYVVQATSHEVKYVREETIFFGEPVIEEAGNALLLHVRPYIGEVVERFPPPTSGLGN